MFLGCLSIRFLQAKLIGRKTCRPGGRTVLPYMAIVKTEKIFSSESVGRFLNNFGEMFFGRPSISTLSHVDWSKKMAARRLSWKLKKMFSSESVDYQSKIILSCILCKLLPFIYLEILVKVLRATKLMSISQYLLDALHWNFIQPYPFITSL